MNYLLRINLFWLSYIYMFEHTPHPTSEDTRTALIVHHPNIYNPFQEPTGHQLTPDRRLIILKDGLYKMVEERKPDQYYPDEAIATPHIVQHWATYYDVIFLFGEGLRVEYLESPPVKGQLLTRTLRHVALLRGDQRFEILTGNDFGDLIEAYQIYQNQKIMSN